MNLARSRRRPTVPVNDCISRTQATETVPITEAYSDSLKYHACSLKICPDVPITIENFMGSYFGFHGRWDVWKKRDTDLGPFRQCTQILTPIGPLGWELCQAEVLGCRFGCPKVAGTPSPRCRNSILTADSESLTMEILRGVGDGKNAQNPDLKPLGPSNGLPKMGHFGRF